MRNGIPISPIISISHRSRQLTNYYKLRWYAAEEICGTHLSLWVWSHFLPQRATSAIFLRVIFSQCNHSQLVLMHLIIYTYHTWDTENDMWCWLGKPFCIPKITETIHLLVMLCNLQCNQLQSQRKDSMHLCSKPSAILGVRLTWLFYEIWDELAHPSWAKVPLLSPALTCDSITQYDSANNKQDKVVWVIMADLGQ